MKKKNRIDELVEQFLPMMRLMLLVQESAKTHQSIKNIMIKEILISEVEKLPKWKRKKFNKIIELL